jgi:hypothetical protein
VSITLGTITLRRDTVSVSEKLEEVGGRDARVVTLAGLVAREPGLSVEAAIDVILDAASRADYTTLLSVRPGRRLWVRRAAFTRETAADGYSGAYTLDLEARDPFEEAVEETVALWDILPGGPGLALAPAGNAAAPLRIELMVLDDLVSPAVGDGTRAITLNERVAAGSALVFDGAAGRVTVDGEDLTGYTDGLFPVFAPGGATLSFSESPGGTGRASARVAFRARWW